MMSNYLTSNCLPFHGFRSRFSRFFYRMVWLVGLFKEKHWTENKRTLMWHVGGGQKSRLGRISWSIINLSADLSRSASQKNFQWLVYTHTHTHTHKHTNTHTHIHTHTNTHTHTHNQAFCQPSWWIVACYMGGPELGTGGYFKYICNETCIFLYFLFGEFDRGYVFSIGLVKK